MGTNTVTRDHIEQWIREGRGQGHGLDYSPFIKISGKKLPTGGNLQYEFVPLLRRHMHLLSANELRIAYFVLWLGVADFREQFPCWPWPSAHPLYLHPDFHTEPIPWSQGTIACAKALGVRHPRYPGTSLIHIPTIDLLVTLKGTAGPRAVALAVKPNPEDEDEDTLLKLAIQEKYCVELQIPWKLVSGALVPDTLYGNLFILVRYSASLTAAQEKLMIALTERLSPDRCLDHTFSMTAKDCGVSLPEVHDAFYRGLWHKRLNVDLREPIVLSEPPVPSDGRWIEDAAAYLFGDPDDKSRA